MCAIFIFYAGQTTSIEDFVIAINSFCFYVDFHLKISLRDRHLVIMMLANIISEYGCVHTTE
jgi:hypothetical protein